MSSECAHQSNQERGSRNQSYVDTRAVGTVSSSVNTISSSGLSNNGQQPCRYFKRLCPYSDRCTYGDRCRFWHPDPRAPPTCRYFLAGHCRYGDGCRYHHPHDLSPPSHDEPQLANMAAFPSVGAVSHAQHKPMPVRRDHAPRSQPRKHSKSSPPELQLEAFFKRAAVVSPRPTVQRPNPVVANTMSALRAVELEQMEIQFPGEQCQLVEKSQERNAYAIDFHPSDPDWRHTSVLKLLVTIPAKCPQEPVHMELASSCGLPEASVQEVNAAIQEEVSLRHESCRISGQFSLMLQPLLHWLDSNVNNIVGILCPSDSVCPSSQWEESSEKEDESVSEESSSGEESESPDQDRASASVHHPKRGTEVRLVGLTLSENVGVVSCMLLKLTMRCTRCKHPQDVCIRPEQTLSEPCSHCHCCFSLTLHANLVHAASPSLAFLDLMGCAPVDVVLASTQCLVSCLECGREQIVRSLSAGQPWVSWCHSCHGRLALGVEQCRFLLHQPGPQLSAPPTGTMHVSRKKEAKFQEGKPLPELGTCAHFKKSHRWLRFPCCGKAYPCDVCHDSSEDHPMELANRTICGYCSREQSYTASSPCVLCGSCMTSTHSSSYWEGGQGCRNKSKMSRNDPHKYINSVTKTACKKKERVGAKGKNNALYK